jgi:catechol 2,3-dioxygenase-like lactoylglutathione lyase family enzyme
MLGSLSHIAVLVADLPAAIHRFQSLLGAQLVEQEHLQESGTDVAVVELALFFRDDKEVAASTSNYSSGTGKAG